MLNRPIAISSLILSSFLWTSCGVNDPGPILIGNTRSVAQEGEVLYTKAAEEDRAGNVKKAIKLYNKTATEYPFAPSAANARLRQAELIDQQGETLEAFDVYDQFLQSFPGSPVYTKVLRRQSEIAHAAMRGEIQTNFLGLKSDLSTSKVVDMLGAVRDRAPKSAIAARAQYAIGQAYHDHAQENALDKETNYQQSVEAYRKLVNDQPNHSLAPEALFKVGQILLENADRGNQNQANLDLSREAFNDYLLQYPGHQRNAEARKMIAKLDEEELQRSLDIVEFYLKTGKTESAKVYLRDILKRSKSGRIHDAAKAHLAELN